MTRGVLLTAVLFVLLLCGREMVDRYCVAIHFYEAVLATLAIVVWYFYQVIFDPDVYPVNFAFLDGRVSEESYKEEHELAMNN